MAHENRQRPEPAIASGAPIGTAMRPKESDTTADILVDRLIAWGVDTIFGLVGDGVGPVIEALRKRQDSIQFVTVRHEEAAAFMACGFAKYTGRIGACIATTGPGAIHLLNGLYDAAYDGAPVIAITGTTYSNRIGTRYQQEVDTTTLVKDIAAYNIMVTGPRHAQAVVDIACRTALATPGLAHLTIPIDVQMKPLSADTFSPPAEEGKGPGSWVPVADVPPADQLDTAAAVLNAGTRTLILAGRGALGARSEVEQVADRLGAPVAKAWLGRTVIPDSSPFSTGSIGHLGTVPSQQMAEECDTLLILGSTMPYLESYPKPGQARCVQVDINPARISLRYAAEVGLTGDVKKTLAALLPRLKKQEDRSFLKTAQDRMHKWREIMSETGNDRSMPLKSQFVLARLNTLLDDDAMISIDCGCHTVFAARQLEFRERQQMANAGNLSTMAPGLPYAIAAQLAYPWRQSVAIVGDGSFTMLMGEMATAVRHKLPVKVVVLKNNSMGMVRFEQEGEGYQAYGVDLQPIDFAGYAEACGAEGYRCARPDEVESTLRKAMASRKPALVEFTVDPDEVPLDPTQFKEYRER